MQLTQSQEDYLETIYVLKSQQENVRAIDVAAALGFSKPSVSHALKDLKEKDSKWEELIQKDMLMGGQGMVRGTPTFFINGRKTQARDLESFKQEIDAILKAKQK